MGFMSFSGRVFYSAIFILSAWQKLNDFGSDGGAAVRILQPKVVTLNKHLESSLGWSLPAFELKYLLLAAITLEGIGGILFIFGSTLGAYLLLIYLVAVTPVMHDFYNFDLKSPEYGNEFIQFSKNLSLLGALLFFVGMKNAYSKKLKKKQIKVAEFMKD